MTILRGIPGSGKSTIAEAMQIASGAVICSADHYFMKEGEYKFNHTLLETAHKMCQDKALEAMSNDISVIIDNTNLLPDHIKVYINMAQKFRATVQLIQVHTNVDTAVARNVHNVPSGAIRNMNKYFFDHYSYVLSLAEAHNSTIM